MLKAISTEDRQLQTPRRLLGLAAKNSPELSAELIVALRLEFSLCDFLAAACRPFKGFQSLWATLAEVLDRLPPLAKVFVLEVAKPGYLAVVVGALEASGVPNTPGSRHSGVDHALKLLDPVTHGLVRRGQQLKVVH